MVDQVDYYQVPARERAYEAAKAAIAAAHPPSAAGAAPPELQEMLVFHGTAIDNVKKVSVVSLHVKASV